MLFLITDEDQFLSIIFILLIFCKKEEEKTHLASKHNFNTLLIFNISFKPSFANIPKDVVI